MQVKNENFSDILLSGQFQINKKYCLCCNKKVQIYLFMTSEKLLFYYDNNKTKKYGEILRKLVLAINRRFRTEEDKNILSIYYLEKESSLIIKELKLQSTSRDDTEKWIHILNKTIKPKKVQFPNSSINYIKANNIYHFKNNCDFYVALSNLEYILLKNKLKDIFEIYRKSTKNNNIHINSTTTFNEDELLNEK